MNSIDLKILEMLQTNSGRTAKEMATELSLTTTPVYERIKKLEKAGFIKQYVALLNTDLLNMNIIVFMNITIKDHHKEARDEFVKNMEALEEISEFYYTSGNFDFLAKVRFSNIHDYRHFLVDKVSSIRNINGIDSQIVLKEIKYSTRVVL
jgi:Lrp/AsnC family leucine-responsive transcriptional regulator